MRRSRDLFAAATSCVFVLSLALAGCAGGSTARVSKTPTSLPATAPPGEGATSTPTGGAAPAGWYSVFPDMRFTDISDTDGLIAGVAEPGRLVGCALPDGADSAPSTLATSTDDGHSWRTNAIGGVPAMSGCVLVEDAQDPTSFMVAPVVAVNPGSPSNFTVYGTANTGQSWQVIAPPDGYNIDSLAGGTTTLVAGHLLALLSPVSAGAGYALGERLPDGSWHVWLTLAGVASMAWPPVAWAIDPANSSQIYVAVHSGPAGVNVTVLASRDGGASWQSLVTWPHGEIGVRLWTAAGNRVFGQPMGDNGSTEPFYFSEDGGATWTRTLLPDNAGFGGSGVVTVNPAGTVVAVIANQVLEFDQATGQFVKVGPGPGEVQNGPGTFPDGFICAVTMGSAPALVCSGVGVIGGSDNYGFPLPAHF